MKANLQLSIEGHIFKEHSQTWCKLRYLHAYVNYSHLFSHYSKPWQKAPEKNIKPSNISFERSFSIIHFQTCVRARIFSCQKVSWKGNTYICPGKILPISSSTKKTLDKYPLGGYFRLDCFRISLQSYNSFLSYPINDK